MDCYAADFLAPYIDGKPNGTYLAWHPMEVINGNSGYNKNALFQL